MNPAGESQLRGVAERLRRAPAGAPNLALARFDADRSFATANCVHRRAAPPASFSASSTAGLLAGIHARKDIAPPLGHQATKRRCRATNRSSPDDHVGGATSMAAKALDPAVSRIVFVAHPGRPNRLEQHVRVSTSAWFQRAPARPADIAAIFRALHASSISRPDDFDATAASRLQPWSKLALTAAWPATASENHRPPCRSSHQHS